MDPRLRGDDEFEFHVEPAARILMGLVVLQPGFDLGGYAANLVHRFFDFVNGDAEAVGPVFELVGLAERDPAPVGFAAIAFIVCHVDFLESG